MGSAKIQLLIGLSAILTAFVTASRATGCDDTVGEISKTLDRENYFVFFLYEKTTKETEAISKKVEEIVNKYAGSVNLDFQSSQLDKLEKEEKKIIVDDNGVKKFPVSLLVTPGGKLLYKKEEALTEKELKKHIYSPMKKEILKSLKKYEAVVLFIAGEKAKDRKKVLKNTKKAAKVSEDVISGKVKIIELDPGDKKEEYLLKNLEIPPTKDKIFIIMVFGRGKAVYPLKDNISATNIADYIQILSHNCSCGFPWHRVGQDLLMDEDPDTKKEVAIK